MRTFSRRSVGLTTTMLGVASIGLSLLSSPASASHDVEPVETNITENITCAELGGAEPNPPDFSGGQTWLEEKFDPPADGTQNGITVDMIDDKTFNWTSTIGIDAVYVKGGGGSQIYVYAPDAAHEESFGDEGLSLATDQQISHISFCYDTANPEVEETTTTTAPETTTTTAPETTTTTEAEVLPTTIVRETTSTTAAAQVLGVQQTRELPRTGRGSAPLGYLGLGLLGTGLVLVGQHRRTRAF